ncbi:MAG TPA: heme-binding protein [Thermoanaerobaculia bacterium]|nr:heme-binding protein [Thermoanaerobaculia bacterium]
MNALRLALVALLVAGLASPAEARRRRPPRPPAPKPGSPAAATCPAGISLLTAAEVDGLLTRAAASVDLPKLAVAVADRAGTVLGLYTKGSPTLAEQDTAVGLARTGAFFSNDQAPLTSRTVRFVSGLHFPPGVARTPNAALYGIENTNRGCDLNVSWNPGKFVPRATSLSGQPCNPFDASGCGTGPVTGKIPNLSGAAVDSDPFAVNPGGLPVFRGSRLIGGIGVAGVPPGRANAAEFAALAAFGDGLAPLPTPLPAPGVVFIDGIRLPAVLQTTRPAGVGPGAANGAFAFPSKDGGCAPDGYLVGPLAGSALTAAEVDRVVQQAVAAAGRTRAVIRLPLGSKTRMVISVGDVDGRILAIFRMPDATVFSIDVAAAKARNVAYFSGPGALDLPEVPPGTAISNRTLSFGGQPLFPAGIDGSGPGPFFDLFADDLRNPCGQGFAPPDANQSGIVFFPGSLPLYKGDTLVGGLGVSGDGVEQDDYVSYRGAAGFLPPERLWADRHFVDGVRLPFLKFPRNPER